VAALFVILFPAFFFVPTVTRTIRIPPDGLPEDDEEQYDSHDCDEDKYDQEHYRKLALQERNREAHLD
jgi:hypothetical protein